MPGMSILSIADRDVVCLRIFYDNDDFLLGVYVRLTLSLDGSIFRGLKVKNAQDQGMIACIIYTDPAQDGNVTVENGYAEYPDGGARNPSQVQRGSVQFLSTYPGMNPTMRPQSTCGTKG